MTIARSAVGAVVLTAFVLGACGSSSPPRVGDCIDAQKHVVGCNSVAAAQRLVSDLKAPNAIACVQIGNKPQVEVRVDGHPFCAESR
jgi:hypothetical protein